MQDVHARYNQKRKSKCVGVVVSKGKGFHCEEGDQHHKQGPAQTTVHLKKREGGWGTRCVHCCCQHGCVGRGVSCVVVWTCACMQMMLCMYMMLCEHMMSCMRTILCIDTPLKAHYPPHTPIPPPSPTPLTHTYPYTPLKPPPPPLTHTYPYTLPAMPPVVSLFQLFIPKPQPQPVMVKPTVNGSAMVVTMLERTLRTMHCSHAGGCVLCTGLLFLMNKSAAESVAIDNGCKITLL